LDIAPGYCLSAFFFFSISVSEVFQVEEGLSLSEKEFSLFCEVITSFHTIRNMAALLATISWRFPDNVGISDWSDI
jgi:hypothetical protein